MAMKMETLHELVARATNDSPTSLSGLVSTLIPAGIIAGVMVLAFFILRRTQQRIYSPRSYVSSLREQERSPSLPTGMFNWIRAFWQVPDDYILTHNSMDGYLVVRYLKMCVVMMFVGALITWPILFPINITGGGNGGQLDMLSMANVTHPIRYYAHTAVAWLYFTFILAMITRECIFYIGLRQAYLLSPLYCSRLSQRTILITSIPAEYLTLTQLARIFGPSFKNAWIATDTKKLEELVKQRDKVAFKLEAAETKLIVTANKARMKAHKGGAAETGKDVEASQYLSHKDRPTHRTKFLIGKKVDTIDWCRTELARTIPEVQAAQDAHRSKEGSKSDGAAFIEFHSQSAAQSAVQVLQHHLPLHMSPRYIGMRPQEVVWSSLNLSWKQRVVRKWIYVAFVSVLIIFWAIPIAAAGLISNIKFLQTTFPFLSFLNKIPGPIFGVISGLLPTVAVAILVALVPIVLRLAAKWAGATSQSELDLGLQNTYYIFQVVQVFLVVTIASSASAAGGQIAANPGSTLTLLSTQLPKASNFYINFLILQGLIISSKAVLQIVGLLLFKILGRFLDSTPRKQYKRWSNLAGLTVGSTLPGLTLLVMIAITYSIISPLVLGFATIGIGFIYMAFRYNVMFVFSLDIDTNGRCYPRALMQLMVGVYLAELLLIGLFLVNVAIGPMVLMIIYTVFTILYHMSLTSALGPLFVYLPKNLEVEEESLLQLERGNGPQTGVTNGNTGEKPPLTSHTSAMRTSTKKPSMIMHFLKPHVYCNYATLRQTVPTDFAEIRYEAEVERQAYHNPAISSAAPLLWIPRDTMGISREEIAGSKSAIAMTDESAFLDDKGKVKFDEGGRIPIHEDKIYY